MRSIDILKEVLVPVIDSTNELLPPDQSISQDQERILFGKGGALDSLGLVNFVVSLEDKLQELTGKPIRLATEAAMSRGSSPFRNIKSLLEYIEEVVKQS